MYLINPFGILCPMYVFDGYQFMYSLFVKEEKKFSFYMSAKYLASILCIKALIIFVKCPEVVLLIDPYI